eukprot:1321075-Pyramimonas_sp.AAC.1
MGDRRDWDAVVAVFQWSVRAPAHPPRYHHGHEAEGAFGSDTVHADICEAGFNHRLSEYFCGTRTERLQVRVGTARSNSFVTGRAP